MSVTGDLLMTFTVEVGKPVEAGVVAGQMRRYIPLGGGTVTGKYNGTVIPGGQDWQLIGPEGRLEIAARYVLELEQGRVEVRSEGMRSGSPEALARLAAGEVLPGSDYYFRTAMRFYTASPELEELNNIIAIAVGERFPKHVELKVYPVL
jgi:hypothetical protein